MSLNEEKEQHTAPSLAASLIPTASLYGSGMVGIGALPILSNTFNPSNEISDSNPTEGPDKSNKFSY
ncbi:hypothetical protein E0485_06290 [Paenibacillus albiflavus]|uniref:Uncharacterized protein n=1 Tax=Paenibacillus albiflavus TaxID=2545760 RepID=A0A4R4EM62_9BACL|nr:hypothetical protein [Paenibacillus albiflavus]TCZ79465.1 hypothetical protein E0485_06290 [Paenibacillus albiflavus]